MSGTKEWMMTLQGMPEYQEGWEAYRVNPVPRNPYTGIGEGQKYEAWRLGYQDAKQEDDPDDSEDW